MNAIKTKIIATIGPCTDTYDVLKKLHKAGMNVARINMSHATHKDAQNVIDLVRQINAEQSADYGPIGLFLILRALKLERVFIKVILTSRLEIL